MNNGNVQNDILNTFAYNFSNLNFDGIANLMEDNIKYDGGNLTKAEYLDCIEVAFSFLKSENVHQLDVLNITCLRCNQGLTGFVFVCPVLRIYYSFILEINDNKLTDLIECSSFHVNCSDNHNIKRYQRALVKPDDFKENYNDLPF